MYCGDSTFATFSTFTQIYLETASGMVFLIHKSGSFEKSFFAYSNSNFSQAIA
jgi:hypothetical protein